MCTGFKQLPPGLETDFTHVARWLDTLGQREALQRGMAKLAWGVAL